MPPLQSAVPRPQNLYMDKPQAHKSVPARILVVDDDAADAEALRALLSEDGHEVDQAASTEDALARFREGTYAIVVADVQLPGRERARSRARAAQPRRRPPRSS